MIINNGVIVKLYVAVHCVVKYAFTAVLITKKLKKYEINNEIVTNPILSNINKMRSCRLVIPTLCIIANSFFLIFTEVIIEFIIFITPIAKIIRAIMFVIIIDDLVSSLYSCAMLFSEIMGILFFSV